MNILDEAELQTDPKYKNYVTAVDKALRGFEYSSEWADLISALGKLIKVLQSNSRYNIIPRRLLIGKRLAQCTHPALPSGVHLKALETYDLIFKTIGPKLLCQDMFIYSAGIFPLLGYAAMPVKPVLLNLYEEHYLPLGEHLKPSLTGLLQGILPGLEEGSDQNERTQTLLEQLCAGMVKSNFYCALWDCVLHSPSVRLPAIAFVLSQVDRKIPMKEQAYIMGNNRLLLIESVCSALFDNVALVQRNILELILVLFPIHEPCIPIDDITKILTAALHVLLRRDMSLNRRLYAWLLGHEVNGVPAKIEPRKVNRSDSNLTTDSVMSTDDETSVYFETYSKEILIQSLKTWLHRTPHEPGYAEKKSSILKPYRLLISLIDKPEVSTTIIDDIFIEVFRALYNRCTKPIQHEESGSKVRESGSQVKESGSKVRREVLHGADRPTDLIKTANMLFGTFEAYFMWDFIARKFEKCCQERIVKRDGDGRDGDGRLTCSELCMLVEFLLDIVSLETYIETPTEYLPQLLCKITMTLTNYCSYLSLEEINNGLRLCAKLLTKVQPSMVLSPDPVDEEMESDTPEETEWEMVKKPANLQQTRRSSSPTDSTPSKNSQQSLDRIGGSSESDKVEAEVDDMNSEGDAVDALNHDENNLDIKKMRKVTMSPERSLDRLSSDPKGETLLREAEEEKEEISLDKAMRPGADSLSLHSDAGSETRHAIESKLRGGSISSLTASMTESERETAPVFLMQACVQCFQSFFFKFVSRKIVPSADAIKAYAAKLQVAKRAGMDSRQPVNGEDVLLKLPKGLEELIEREQPENGRIRTDSVLTNDSSTSNYLDDVTLESDSSTIALQAFSTACHLLVEFACFPMYCNETVSAALLKTPKINGNVMSLPDWLHSLLACCCFVYNVPIQSTAISTIIELIGLTKSVTGGSSDNALVLPNPPNSPKTDSGTISVVLIPAISTTHLDCINYSSNFFQRVSVNLWSQLGSRTPDHHQKSADLLHQLHNVTPDVFISEDIIGNSLVQHNKVVCLESHSKFATLWHLVRGQILSSSPASKLRTFDRSLFVMLDSLEHPDCMVRSVTQSWLVHAINRGDIARILEPILLVLLHPATARVSVQFLQTRTQQELEQKEVAKAAAEEQDAVENKIYSISSINGEVKYYVVKDGKRALAISPGNKDPVFACTALDEKQKYVTKTNMGQRYTPPSQGHILNKTLSVTVNPMSQQAYYSDSDSDHSAPLQNSIMKAPALTMPKTQSFDEQNLRKYSTPSSAIGINNSNKRGNERRKSNQEERKSEPSSSPSSQGMLDDKLSHSASTDNLSDEENYEEPSYFYNEEVNETVEDAVRSVLASVIDKVVIEVEGEEGFQKEDLEAPESPEKGTPRRLNIGSQSSALQGEKLSPDDMVLDDLESAMSGLETEHSDVEGLAGIGIKRRENVQDGDAKLLTGLKLNTVRPLQQHILLYVQVFDAQRMLYVIATLKSILNTNPRPFVCAMSSTSISSTNTPQLIKLQQVLARHKRCITGVDFYNELEPEALTLFRSSTYLEIVILICVYFMRSYYPQDLKANQSDVQGNRDVQIASMEVLRQILHELVDVVKDSGRGLATFISDLLSRCKVQKAVLYCILATVYHARRRSSKHNNSKEKDIIQDVPKDLSNQGAQAFQVQLLKLSHTIIILEDQLFSLKDDTDTGILPDNEWECYRIKHVPNNSLAFIRTARFSCQGILLTAMLSALKQHHNCHIHRHWVLLLTDSLPYLEYGLPKMAIPVVNQLCRNLEVLAVLYKPLAVPAESGSKAELELDNIPPDHVINMLEGLTTICHFCLLESTSSLSAMSGRHTVTNSSEAESNASAPLFSSLFGALTRDRTKSTTNQSSTQSNTPKSEARKGLLGMLPRIIASVAKLWSVVQKCERSRDAGKRSEEATSLSFGSPKSARQQILELLSPIALHHAGNLLAAIGVVWSDCRKRHKVKQTKVNPSPSDEQLVLVELVSAIRAMPLDTLVQTIKQVLKAPPFTIKDKNQPGLEVSMLQFLYCYIQRMTVGPLRDSWHSILSLLKEGLQLNLTAPGHFLLLGIVNEIVPKLSPFEERKEQRDLQEICQRLLEACNLIAGSSLEQTTWLRRNVSVKIQEENIVESDASDSAQGGADSPTEVTAITNSEQPMSPQTSAAITRSYSQYSVHALTLLAELLSQMLDLIYQSDEKERVVPLLTAIMHNVTPYLKNHSAPNMPSYRACTALVSSLSGYQYTRKAWKRDAFELLLDPGFFQMDASSIRGWKPIIENLMTHDKTTFKDLMARVAAFQNTSLNPFASREAEMDQRAQLLKRLSFTLFCSEVDQYVRALPDIQERLAESLRLLQVPSLHEQVFLCFRVLLLRISPHHLTGLWPTLISEMVQVFLFLEEQLAALLYPDTAKKSAFKRVTASDFANFFLGNSNAPKGLSSIPRSWLGLYLSACKLLDLALCLPSDDIPQFQVYKWAFIGETSKRDSETQFVPHIARAAKLLRTRFKMEGGVNPPASKSPRGRPLITAHSIKSVAELLPFFNAVCPTDQPSTPDNSTQTNGPATKVEEEDGSVASCSNNEYIERLVERDFLVPLS